MNVNVSGKCQLQPHQPGQHQRDQPDRQRGRRILDGDDLGVLGEDVGRPPTLGMVKFDIRDLGGRWQSRSG